MERDTEHTHPALPDQPDHGFAEGAEEIRREDRDPDFARGVREVPEEREPDFARGVREGPEVEVEHKGRFSEGVEEFPDSPEKLREGDFATGIEGGPPED